MTIPPVLAVLAYLWLFWLLYVATMGLYRAHLARRLVGVTRLMGWPLVLVAGAVDVVANLTLAVVLFADPPREWLVTTRLRRYMAEGRGWRFEVAEYVCTHLLDPYDPTGNHC